MRPKPNNPIARLGSPLKCFSALLTVVVFGFALSTAPAKADGDGVFEWLSDLFTWPPFGIGSKSSEGLRAPYKVKLKLTGAKELESRIKSTSALFAQRKKPPATLIGVERRANEDVKRLGQLMRSEGYFARRISGSIDDRTKPPLVTLVVVSGPRYRFNPSKITGSGGLPTDRLLAQSPKSGTAYSADKVVAAQSGFIRHLSENGFPFAKINNRRIVVDHKSKRVTVTWRITSGQLARFGAVRISGASFIDHMLIRNRIAWRQGGRYDLRLVEKTRENLRTLGVFASVRILPNRKNRRPNGQVPITITVTERKRRTIGASAFYDSSIGPGGEVEWTHRNLFGGAESLNLKVGGSSKKFGASGFFKKPDIFGGPQDFLANARYEEFNLDSYDGREAVAGFAIERRFGKKFKLKAGPVFDWSIQTQTGVRREFTLFGFLFSGNFDGSDNLLDPTKGYRLKIEASPYIGRGLTFTRLFARGSVYWTPPAQRRFTLAAWGKIGSVLGESLAALPPNKKIYAGGGSSVRGFGFQRIGPLDAADNPTGGRSLAEGGLELRMRFGKTWGGVMFVEAGSVSSSVFPSFDEGIRIGVGAGVRYYSPVGLIRLDLATPINRRRGDSPIQIYISIGQAF